MSTNSPAYKSYLLRLIKDAPGAPWRATLKTISEPGEPRHFADLESLAAFLLAEFEARRLPPSAAGPKPTRPER